MKLNLVGNRVEIDGVAELTTFGQSVEVEDSLGRELRTKGTMLTEAEFKAIGFTPQELSEFAESWRHTEAPASFQQKKARALAAAQGSPIPVATQISIPSIAKE